MGVVASCAAVMPKRTSIPLVLALLASSAAASTPPTPLTLVICAPGYPGSTAEAQPSMDTLAAAVSRAAGWPVGTVKAEYQETEAGGIARFKGKGDPNQPSAWVCTNGLERFERDYAEELRNIRSDVKTGNLDNLPNGGFVRAGGR